MQDGFSDFMLTSEQNHLKRTCCLLLLHDNSVYHHSWLTLKQYTPFLEKMEAIPHPLFLKKNKIKYIYIYCPCPKYSPQCQTPSESAWFSSLTTSASWGGDNGWLLRWVDHWQITDKENPSTKKEGIGIYSLDWHMVVISYLSLLLCLKRNITA